MKALLHAFDPARVIQARLAHMAAADRRVTTAFHYRIASLHDRLQCRNAPHSVRSLILDISIDTRRRDLALFAPARCRLFGSFVPERSGRSTSRCAVTRHRRRRYAIDLVAETVRIYDVDNVQTRVYMLDPLTRAATAMFTLPGYLGGVRRLRRARARTSTPGR